jgi:hypothetical protein
MGIAITGLLSGIAGATRNAARVRDHDRAVQLARLRMNELLVDWRLPRDVPVAGPFDPAISGGLDAGWQARLTTFELPPVPTPGQLALDRIGLEVWWDTGGQRRSLTLEAFRPRILKPEDIAPAGAVR